MLTGTTTSAAMPSPEQLMIASEPAISSSSSGHGGWASLGGYFEFSTYKIAVGQNADGRLELFGRAVDGTIWHCWQNSPNGGWSDWTSLGGNVYPPIVSQNADGRLEVFALGVNTNVIQHCWQTAPNSGWSSWTSLGGAYTVTGGLFTVDRNADGQLEVFIRGTNGVVQRCSQTAANSGWGSWSSLGGQLINALSVAQNADGRLEVFGRGISSDVQHCWQNAANSGWGNWSSLGWPAANRWIDNQIEVDRNEDGRLEVFARANDGALWHCWQTAPNGGWSAWASLDKPGGLSIGYIAVGQNFDGRLEVFAWAGGNTIWHCWQTVPNGGWSDWAFLGNAFSSPMAVAQNADGRLEVFARGTDNALWHRWQSTPGSWL